MEKDIFNEPVCPDCGCPTDKPGKKCVVCEFVEGVVPNDEQENVFDEENEEDEDDEEEEGG